MKKTISVFIIVLLLLTVLPAVAFADSYDSGTTTVTIDGAGGMPLQAAVEGALGAEGSGDTAADITHLTIEDGVVYTLSAADIDYIDTALTSMTHLYVGDDTLFNYNGDGTTGDVGGSFLRNNDTILSVSLDNAETFGELAFQSCDALTSVSLPSAKTFGDRAFTVCPVLESVNLPLAETFGVYAFYDCDALTNVSLPNAVTFGDYAFAYSDALTTVSLPKAQTFSNYAFHACIALETISLPKAQTFGVYAFGNCDALTTVILPAVTTFGNDAFYDCTGPVSLTLGSTIPSADADTFGTFPASTSSIAAVPAADVAAYLAVNDGNTTDDLWWGWTVSGYIEKNPQTGDNGYIWIYIAALALLLSFAGVFALKKRTRVN
jgi:LPXTG-motif cell wall-anchored protein